MRLICITKDQRSFVMHCWLIVAQDAVSLRRKCDSSVYSAFPLTVSASTVGIASG